MNDNLISSTNFSVSDLSWTITNYDSSSNWVSSYDIVSENEKLKKEIKELKKSHAYLASTVNKLIVEIKKLNGEISNK